MQHLTTREAAVLLGITPRRVRQLVKAGILLATRHGRDFVITTDAVEAARQRRTTKPQAA